MWWLGGCELTTTTSDGPLLELCAPTGLSSHSYYVHSILSICRFYMLCTILVCMVWCLASGEDLFLMDLGFTPRFPKLANIRIDVVCFHVGWARRVRMATTTNDIDLEGFLNPCGGPKMKRYPFHARQGSEVQAKSFKFNKTTTRVMSF